jgi:hypothetical protein
MCEVNEGDTSYENQHPGVVALTLWFERIIAKFVAIGFIVNIVFFVK